MKTALLRHAATAALPCTQNPCLSRKQGMLSFAPSPLLIFVFSSEQRSWKTLWKECHSVCIFFTYYTLEKLFRTSLSLTLHPLMLPALRSNLVYVYLWLKPENPKPLMEYHCGFVLLPCKYSLHNE